MSRVVTPFLVALLAVTAVSPIFAQSWNAYSDFNTTVFPAHDWSYVYQPGGSWSGNWNLSNMFVSSSTNWWEAPIAPNYYGPQAGITSEWDRVRVTGCKKGDDASRQPALGLLQWRAPENGYYRISGDAYLYPQTTSRLFSYSDRLNAPILDATLNTTFTPSAFDKTVLLNKEDRIVFGGEPVTGSDPYEGTSSYWTVNINRVPTVPAPWTPVVVSGTTVKCWNRDHDFSDKLMPVTIKSGDTQLLSGPISLIAKISGVQQNWGAATFTVDQANSEVALITTTAESTTLRATCKWRFEFDGMLLCDLTLAPKSGAITVSAIDLQIPFSSSIAKLFHHHPIKPITQQNWGTDAMNCGAVPSAGMSLPFVHHMWVGDEKRGLQWFAESDQGLAPVGSFININSSKMMRLSLIGYKNLSTTQPFRFTFGFMASPVKPLVPHDDVRWAFPGGGIGIYNHDYNGTPSSPENSWLAQLDGKGVNCLSLWNSQAAFGDPLISNPDLPNLLNAADGYDIGVLSATGVWVGEDAEGYNSSWVLGPMLTYTDPTLPGIIAHAMCQRSGWRKWFLDRAEEAVTRQQLDGLYLDGSGCAQICNNTAHGCGYMNGSTLKGTLPILPTRELMKQLYLITRSVPGRKFVLAHTSSSITLPCLSFADAYLEGEHINGYPETNQPLNSYNNSTYTIEGYRAQMIGHPFGIPAFYLKYGKQGYYEEDARRGAAYAMVHGMMPLALDHAPLMWNAYSDFGAASAQWVPYWETTRPITSSNTDLKISSYVKQGQGVLSVVANLTQASITTTLNINRASLGLDERARVRNLETGKNISIDADTASITVGPGCYALLFTDYNTQNNQNLVADAANGATATYTCSTPQDTSHAASFAADGSLNTNWMSKLETWKTSPTPRPAIAWWQVEWSAAQTFNRVEVCVPTSCVPNEFLVETWDTSASKWIEAGYGKKTDNALTYIICLPQPVTTTKLRYRVLNMNAFSYGPNTQGALSEIRAFNKSNTDWATVTGITRDAPGNAVKGAHTYLHLTRQQGDPVNWDNIHLLGTRTGADGSYRITVDPSLIAGKVGADKVCVFANGMSMSESNPTAKVASAPVTIAAGQAATCDVTLPGPAEAALELGGAAPGPWLTQSLNIPFTNWEMTNTTRGGRSCANIAPGIEMCFYLNPNFADGRTERMYVDVDYFDEGNNGIKLMGPPIPESFTGGWYAEGASRIRKENTNTWRTQTLVFENTFLTGWWLNGNQFGMFSLLPFADGIGSTDEPNDYIGSVKVRFAPRAFAGLPSVTLGTAGSDGDHVALRCEDNGLHPRFAPAVLGAPLGSFKSPSELDGRSLYETTGSRRYIVFDADNHYAFGPQTSLTLKIDYYYPITAPVGAKLRVEVRGASGSNSSKEIPWGVPGGIRTAIIRFENIRLSDDYHGCGDILLDDMGYDVMLSRVALIDSTAPQSADIIDAAKALPENTRVTLPAKTVTAKYDTHFYIQEDDRSSGIMVIGKTSATIGQKVPVSGYLVNTAGERAIYAE